MSNSKDPRPVRTCGAVPNHERLLRRDPEFARMRQRILEAAGGWLRRRSAEPLPLVKIPVVVHILARTRAEDLSREQIDSQVAVLNRDFRRLNEDLSETPEPFLPLAADARIEFALATVDPNGAPTDGITRTETSRRSFGADDSMKFRRSGGQDAWAPDRYLNIWVCNLSDGLLGYAQFPGGPRETDGVVILSTAFGTVGRVTEPFHLGRTTTHEVGHWLDLVHIWGDDLDRCGGSDLVEDTPNQAGPNTGKPRFPKISCNNGPHGDLFMNFMDYSDDDAMSLFTAGQVLRMRAALATARPGFLPKPPTPCPSA